MAKAVGVDAGEYEVKVVELDGSLRRPRLARFGFEPVGESGGASAANELHAARQAEATALALEDGGFPRDSLHIGFPCREAVLRTLNVPFVGEDQIRKVIKFEAEGSIHSHNVDDMIVDFHALAESKKETKVLIAAVPKTSLRVALSSLEHSGLEPLVVDLDTMALFRTAEWCGAFEAEAGADAVPADAPPARVVVDVGARSTRVLFVVNGELADMRTLRTGVDSMAEEIATKSGLALTDAREALWESLRTGQDYAFGAREVEVASDETDDDATDDEGEAAKGQLVTTPAGVVTYGDVLAGLDRYRSRLRRELLRFLTSVPSGNRVEAVWSTGGGSTLPQVNALLGEVFGPRPEPLDVLGGMAHKLSDEEVEELNPKLAVAVGLALRALGGRRGFNFRQEELAFTKGFDRVKFPLALTCMLALFLVLVYAVRLRDELVGMEKQYGATHSIEEGEGRRGTKTKKILFNGYLGAIVNAPNGWFARYYEKKDYAKLVEKLDKTPVFQRLPTLRRDLSAHFNKLRQESGYYPDLRIGSGLGALVELAKLMRGLESELGRFLLVDLSITLQPKDESRYMTFRVALRTDEKSSFRTKGERLKAAIEAACSLPTSSFSEIHDQATGEKEVFQGEGGEGYFFDMRINLKPEDTYPVFPASQS